MGSAGSWVAIIGALATAISTVGAVAILVVREWRRQPSAGIPPGDTKRDETQRHG